MYAVGARRGQQEMRAGISRCKVLVLKRAYYGRLRARNLHDVRVTSVERRGVKRRNSGRLRRATKGPLGRRRCPRAEQGRRTRPGRPRRLLCSGDVCVYLAWRGPRVYVAWREPPCFERLFSAAVERKHQHADTAWQMPEDYTERTFSKVRT